MAVRSPVGSAQTSSVYRLYCSGCKQWKDELGTELDHSCAMVGHTEAYS